jgi:tetratricopeptide (TPR) repeat protein
MREGTSCIIAALVAAPLLLAGPAIAATSTCEDAVHAFDAAYGERSDEAALAAARALSSSCPGAAGVRSTSRVAMIFYARKDYDRAIAAFKEAIQAQPDPRMYMSLCGVQSQAGLKVEALETCRAGLKLAKAADDGTPAKHANVLDLGFNTALVRIRLRSDCDDHTVFEMFDAYREAHPDHAWVHQLLGAWVWDCEKDFDKGLALYKKSCALGQKAACDQVKYTESCQCQTRLQ